MSELQPYRATIPAVPHGVPRPLWSVMIPTYNGTRYLRETLVSVLAQDLGPEVMQIEVVDDHSTQDEPAAIVEELGAGRVSLYRQSENVGYIRNFETCLKRARGKLIHLLHDDDYVRDGFYCKLQRAFDENSEIGAAFCRHIYMYENDHREVVSELEIPESGILHNWLEQIAAVQRLVTPSIVVRRDVYEKLGGFDRRLSCAGEDWEMWVRIAAHYRVWYEVEPLAVYRTNRAGSLWGRSLRTGAAIRDMRRATEIIESYLPEHLPRMTARNLSNKARKEYAFWAIESALRMLAAGDRAAAIVQMQEAVKFVNSFKMLRSIIIRSLLVLARDRLRVFAHAWRKLSWSVLDRR